MRDVVAIGMLDRFMIIW